MRDLILPSEKQVRALYMKVNDDALRTVLGRDSKLKLPSTTNMVQDKKNLLIKIAKYVVTFGLGYASKTGVDFFKAKMTAKREAKKEAAKKEE